ncbi:MAG TPA: NAD(P)/FAD-dependent oxidoreductase [Solirubrobacteraceae bacterium]|nr:NAD(P)/FAD-dependent oxidoreductase [Solirubrobacteraceae bacterium]
MKAIVVGAGFAGLAAADELVRSGAEVEVFEARDRVGGRVWSVPFAGAVVERGAEFILPHDRTVLAVVDRLGLTLVRKGTLYGNREPRGGPPVSRGDVLSAVKRLGSEQHAGTLADTLARDRELDSGVAGVIEARLEVSCAYPATDLDASVLSEGAGAFGDFDTWTVAGGNDRIARELAGRLDGAVRLSSPVSSVAWHDRGVSVVSGGDEAVADAAVIAVPASVLGRIAFDPPLVPEKSAVRYGQAAKLFVGLRTPAPPSQVLSVPDRFWCYTQLGRDGKPLPFVAALAGSPGALEALGVADGPDRWLEVLARVRPDLDLDVGTVLLSTWAEDPWVRGAYSAASAVVPLDRNALAGPVGPLVFAGEHTAGGWHGLMEGALRSGIRAAQQVLQPASR